MRSPRGIICLVTDSARLAPGGTCPERHAALVSQAEAAGAAGIDFIQIREADFSARQLHALTKDIVAAAGARTRVLVNDRLDVAIAAGASGVHLRGGSLGAMDARALAPTPFVVSRAVHGSEEVRAAAAERAADFVVFGTVFPTRSKPAGQAVAGLAALSDASRYDLPVLAIGGINASTVRAVATTAAAGVAAIGWFLTTDAGRIAEAAALIRQTFDTTEPVI